MGIEIGKSYKFDYPKVFTTLPDYAAHIGQQVTVLRELEDGVDYDRGECERGYIVEASDGWHGVAWESELLASGEARKWS